MSQPTAKIQRFLRACLGLIAASVLLGACAPEPPPNPDPRAQPTAELTSSPTSPAASAEPPDLPDPIPGMEEDSAAGAIAAVQYFFALYLYSYDARDVTDWDRMSGPDCAYCSDARATFVDDRDPSNELGGDLSLINMHSEFHADEGLYIVAFDLLQEDVYLTSATAPPEPFQGGFYPESLIAIEYTAEGWVVIGVDLGERE